MPARTKPTITNATTTASIDVADSMATHPIVSADRPRSSVLRPEDSEPLLNVSNISTGESNVHFVPESVEEEEGHHDILAEEKSLIEDLLEDHSDRPRLPTPPSSLTKVVSFGDVTNSPLGSMTETILPPPKQFHAKHRHTPSISSTPHAPFPSAAPQHYVPQPQYSQPSKGSYHAQPPYVQPPPSALRRRSSVRSTSSGGSAPVSLGMGPGASERRRTSVPAGSLLPAAAQPHGPALHNVSYASDNVLRNVNNNMISEAVVPQYYYMEKIDESVTTMMQRSVSEKSRERSAQAHRLPYQYSNQYVPADTEAPARRPTGDIRSSNVGTVAPIPPLKQQKSALSHVHSTPNVASIRGGIYSNVSSYARHGSKTASSSSITNVTGMCSAVSEGELLDLAILPIFQKLLSERHKSRSGYGASIASCPNISIKCDIVEYL
ncbi:Uncharacterized protein GBIM_15816 [Gryllus bimaculatus]|nr:Uncharacterized protein GBIM_15816 [Gryllus bimaculatus]